jgi:capping protein (actin filament) muscle Z-line, beta
MEEEANTLFDTYRELYYEGGVSSVYLWDLEESGGFAGAFLIKKMVGVGDKYIKNGSWDSIHIVEVQEQAGTPKKATYKLTTTVMLDMGMETSELGNTNLAGSLTRQATTTKAVTDAQPHIANMGRLIEDMEIDMRSNINELYILKTREVLSNIRKQTSAQADPMSDHVSSLNSAIMTHASIKGAASPAEDVSGAKDEDTSI